jgi:hypothetical protein
MVSEKIPDVGAAGHLLPGHGCVIKAVVVGHILTGRAQVIGVKDVLTMGGEEVRAFDLMQFEDGSAPPCEAAGGSVCAFQQSEGQEVVDAIGGVHDRR